MHESGAMREEEAGRLDPRGNSSSVLFLKGQRSGIKQLPLESSQSKVGGHCAN